MFSGRNFSAVSIISAVKIKLYGQAEKDGNLKNLNVKQDIAKKKTRQFQDRMKRICGKRMKEILS